MFKIIVTPKNREECGECPWLKIYHYLHYNSMYSCDLFDWKESMYPTRSVSCRDVERQSKQAAKKPTMRKP